MDRSNYRCWCITCSPVPITYPRYSNYVNSSCDTDIGKDDTDKTQR